MEVAASQDEDWAEFEMYVNDELVCGASGPRERAWNEILHYVTVADMAEGQEFEVQEITRRVVPFSLNPPPRKRR